MRAFLPAHSAAAAIFVAVFLVVTAYWAGITSNLLIELGKQFVLGGGQPGSFRVEAHNVGKLPVEFKERPRGVGIFGKTTLAPGARATLRFKAGSTALLLNPSGQQARVDLRITSDTRLSMTYEPNRKI
ncbi:hypothetical protein [Hymenobacter pini]|uniref:hypothetical protein n=1 Tax=Hymenobacter pini TaxID=2880879 RepID=UPI001CF48D84|nr:hypothetical protein [Hymenobacter pini]MCA8829655.1 hypothetical protein [Hymenobacter pini]